MVKNMWHHTSCNTPSVGVIQPRAIHGTLILRFRWDRLSAVSYSTVRFVDSSGILDG